MAELGFDKFMADFVLPWEGVRGEDGGYTDDPGDPGGETKWGVSKRSYPNLDIPNLTKQFALQNVYFLDYWLKTGKQKSYCDALPHPANLAHLDCVVNVGNWKTAKDGTPVWHGRANMILQIALGVDDDGYIGPATLTAIAGADPLSLAVRALDQRDFYYAGRLELPGANLAGSWADKYRGGWRNRTTALRRYLGLPARDPALFTRLATLPAETETGG
jgi:lysozyme family protein